MEGQMPLNYMQRQALEWCQEQLGSNQQQLELLESGKMTTGENKGNGWVDTTQANIADIKRRSEGLERVIGQYEQLDA